MRLQCAKTAEQIDVVFRVETVGDPKHIALDGGPDFPRQGGSEWGERSIVKHRNIARITMRPSANDWSLVVTYLLTCWLTQTIEWAVSTWPMRVLRVLDMVPLEDALDDDYLTVPFDSNEEVSLADCFVLGLLKLKPESNLKLIDFVGFEKGKQFSVSSNFLLPH